jgi:hypothetical protein
MDILAALDEEYGAYLAQAARLEREANRPAGLIRRLVGSGRNPGDASLNPAFYKKIESTLAAFAATEPDSASVRLAAEKMLDLAQQNADNGVAKWMLIAVQGLLTPLCGRLSKSDRAALAGRYQVLYPRYTRFPSQEALYKQLISF